MNEYLHDASDAQLRGIVVQVTGSEPTSTAVKSIVGSFKALKGYATFGDVPSPKKEDSLPEGEQARSDSDVRAAPIGSFRLGYTINLNLPATSDIAVFDAIFKSLRQHLL